MGFFAFFLDEAVGDQERAAAMPEKQEKKEGDGVSGFAKTKKAVGEMPDGAKKELLTNLIRKAEFMHDELQKLQKIIGKKGWVEEYQNGENQKGLKKSSEGDTYNQLIKNYTAIMQKILDHLPEKPTGKGDELDEFMKAMSARRGGQTR